MSDTMRSQFEGIKDVNPHRVEKVIGAVISEAVAVEPVPTDEEIDAAFTQIVLDDSYYATPDDLQASYTFDPAGRVEVARPVNRHYLKVLLG